METPAVANQNPGNLRDPNTGGFQQFADPVEGKAALYNDLTAKMTGNSSTGLTPQSTLVDFAKTYAPASDNNDPLQYAANIANKMGVHPDTPIGTLLPRIDDFASAVMSNEDPSATYQQHAPLDMGANQSQQSQGTGQAPQGSQSAAASNLQSDTSLMGQLNARGKEIGQGADIAIGKDNTENPLSGALQVAGGLAGGVNDITNKALEMSPIVRNVEKSLGSAAQSFFGTPVGQSVLSSIQQFQQDHPEASKDVGAGIDIVSAIPIIKGISAAAGLGLDAASKALQPTAEKSLSSDLASAASKKIAGRQILQSSPEVLDTIVKNPDFLPDVIDGRYNTKDAFDNINSQLENIENTKLQPMLQSTTGGAKPVLDLESVRNDALESDVRTVRWLHAKYHPCVTRSFHYEAC